MILLLFVFGTAIACEGKSEKIIICTIQVLGFRTDDFVAGKLQVEAL